MVNQLKLQNVTKYSANDGQDKGSRIYNLSAQDEEVVTQLSLNNIKYTRSSAPEYNKLDCELKYIDRYTSTIKESVKIEGLKIGEQLITIMTLMFLPQKQTQFKV